MKSETQRKLIARVISNIYSSSQSQESLVKYCNHQIDFLNTDHPDISQTTVQPQVTTTKSISETYKPISRDNLSTENIC